MIYFGKFSSAIMLDAFSQAFRKTVYNYNVVASLAKMLRIVVKKSFQCMHCSLTVLALILYGGLCFSVQLPSKVTLI